MDGFVMIVTYGGLPFYLMDEKQQHSGMNGSHAREESLKLHSYITTIDFGYEFLVLYRRSNN